MNQNRPNTNRYLYILLIMTTGLISSQLISFIHVYISNNQYYQKLSAIHEAGYLAVPNLIVMEKLKCIGPAFFGGMFFTFSVGACLTIMLWPAARGSAATSSMKKSRTLTVIKKRDQCARSRAKMAPCTLLSTKCVRRRF